MPEKIIETTVGERVRLLRSKMNLKQRELSESIKVSIKTISDVEQCKANPNYEFLKGLRSKHNVNLDFVMFGIGEPFMPFGKPEKVELGVIEHEEIFLNVHLRAFLDYLLNSRFVRLRVLDFFDNLFRSEHKRITQEVEESKK